MKLSKLILASSVLLITTSTAVANEAKFGLQQALTHSGAVQMILQDVGSFLDAAKKAQWSEEKVHETVNAVIAQLQKNSEANSNSNQYDGSITEQALAIAKLSDAELLRALQEQQFVNLKEELLYHKHMAIAGYSIIGLSGLIGLIFLASFMNS